MKLKNLTLITAATLGLALSGYAAAAEPKAEDKGIPGIEVNKAPGDTKGVPGVDVDITVGMKKLDRNGDEKISKTEASGDAELVAQFKTLDKNADGKLDKSEYAMFKGKGFLGTDDSTPTDEDKLGPGR